MIDSSFMLITGEMPTWNDEWRERVQMSIPDHGKHKTVDEMIDQRIGDYAAFQEYMAVVFSRVEGWLGGIDAGQLDRVVIARPFPPQIASTFSARVAGEGGITVLDALECWIYQHALRHMGEIEHARGLVGLQGMTS
jgi:hypothetical protein